MINKISGCYLTHINTRVINGRQSRLNELGDSIVVKSNHGDIFRNPDTMFLQSTHTNSRDKIVRNKNTIRHRTGFKEKHGRFKSRLFTKILHEDKIFVKWNSIIKKSIFITFKTL